MTKTSFPSLEGQKSHIDCFDERQLFRVLFDFIRKRQVLLFPIHWMIVFFIKKAGIGNLLSNCLKECVCFMCFNG
ncbi:predicted protein [Enterococcus casseliflavus EC30]|nr:predicted protein [Enterococcus casseliflavus EC30]